MDINIKYADLKFMANLKKKPLNKNLEKDFHLYLEGLNGKEFVYVALTDKDEIVGMFAYEIHKYYDMGIIINNEEYVNKKIENKAYLTMIEVKEKYKGNGISKQMVDFAFQIFKEKNAVIQMTNIVLDGNRLVNTYIEVAKKYDLDLLFSSANQELQDKNILINYEKKVEKKSILNTFKK